SASGFSHWETTPTDRSARQGGRFWSPAFRCAKDGTFGERQHPHPAEFADANSADLSRQGRGEDEQACCQVASRFRLGRVKSLQGRGEEGKALLHSCGFGCTGWQAPSGTRRRRTRRRHSTNTDKLLLVSATKKKRTDLVGGTL